MKKEEKNEIKFSIFSIDKSMGENRASQILGIVILIGIIVVFVFYDVG